MGRLLIEAMPLVFKRIAEAHFDRQDSLQVFIAATLTFSLDIISHVPVPSEVRSA